MWSKGPPREIKFDGPMNLVGEGGRRRFELAKEKPRFVYPLATGGDGRLPPVSTGSVPAPLFHLASPRMRSSEIIGSYYYHSKANADVLGSVDLKSESQKAAQRVYQEEEAARRWRGGPRFGAPNSAR